MKRKYWSWFEKEKKDSPVNYNGVVDSVDYSPITGGSITINLNADNYHKDLANGDLKIGQEITIEIKKAP